MRHTRHACARSTDHTVVLDDGASCISMSLLARRLPEPHSPAHEAPPYRDALLYHALAGWTTKGCYGPVLNPYRIGLDLRVWTDLLDGCLPQQAFLAQF